MQAGSTGLNVDKYPGHHGGQKKMTGVWGSPLAFSLFLTKINLSLPISICPALLPGIMGQRVFWIKIKKLPQKIGAAFSVEVYSKNYMMIS